MRKRKYSELQPQTYAILKRIKVTEQEYTSATSSTTQECSSASPHLSDETVDENVSSDPPLSDITNTLS